MTLVDRVFALISILVLSACSPDDYSESTDSNGLYLIMESQNHVISDIFKNNINEYSGYIYGTSYTILTTGFPSKEIEKKINDELNRIDYVFSTYKEDSLISKYNRSKFLRKDEVETTEEFDYVHGLAISISKWTDGAFDPYGKRGLDFSGIAKGYAVDQIGELLEKNSIYNYFIEIGGEIKAVGSKYGSNWVFAIETPVNGKKIPYVAFEVPQSGISIATSGEYRVPDHIWGSGPRDIISISVISRDVASADAWATAMYVMGKDKALAIAEEYEIPIFLIDDNGASIQSTSWGMIPL